MKVKNLSGTVTKTAHGFLNAPTRVIVLFFGEKDFEPFLMAPPTATLMVMRLDNSETIEILKGDLTDVDVDVDVQVAGCDRERR